MLDNGFQEWVKISFIQLFKMFLLRSLIKIKKDNIQNIVLPNNWCVSQVGYVKILFSILD